MTFNEISDYVYVKNDYVKSDKIRDLARFHRKADLGMTLLTSLTLETKRQDIHVGTSVVFSKQERPPCRIFAEKYGIFRKLSCIYFKTNRPETDRVV